MESGSWSRVLPTVCRLRPTLRARFPTNWELSADRATNIVRHLQTLGLDPSMLVAEAFGQYHPIASNETPEGRRKNRRINIVIEDSDLY